MIKIKSTRFKEIGIHLLFWVAYVLNNMYAAAGRQSDSWEIEFPIYLYSIAPIAVFACYLNLYLLIPFYYKTRKYFKYTISVLILLLMAGLATRFFQWWLWIPVYHLTDPLSREPTNYWITVRIVKDGLEYFPVIAASTVLQFMRDLYKNERKLREIENEKSNAEKRMLQAQVNPHFFFNTLNTLYALTLTGSKRSSAFVLRLSDLMHYMLYVANAEKVSLNEEIAYLKNFADIEQMRYSERLELSFQFSGDIEGKMIAPLLLLTFIENAFKHGVENDKGWITVDITVADKTLFLKVENSYTVKTNPFSGGLGLANVKKRLELLYPGAYELHLIQQDETYLADLKLNLT